MSGVEVSGIVESDIEVSEIEMSGIEVSGSGQRLVPTGTVNIAFFMRISCRVC